MIHIHDLRKRYGAVTALNGVSFSAPDGAITGLLGANGAGKTTTMAIVCGLLGPDGSPACRPGQSSRSAWISSSSPRAFLVITWITSLALARGTWRPSARTPAAFLEISVLSCQRRRQAIAAAAVIYAALLAFVLGWKYLTLAPDVSVPVFLMSGSNLTVWAITALLAAAGVHRRRALARELDRLRELRDAMRHLHRAIG